LIDQLTDESIDWSMINQSINQSICFQQQ